MTAAAGSWPKSVVPLHDQRRKIISYAVRILCGVSLVVVLCALWLFWRPIQEWWYLRELRTGTTSERLAASRALGHFRSAKAVSPLINFHRELGHGKPETNQPFSPEEMEIAKALIRIGKPAVGPLLTNLQREDDLENWESTSFGFYVVESIYMSDNRRHGVNGLDPTPDYDSVDGAILSHLMLVCSDLEQKTEVRRRASELLRRCRAVLRPRSKRSNGTFLLSKVPLRNGSLDATDWEYTLHRGEQGEGLTVTWFAPEDDYLIGRDSQWMALIVLLIAVGDDLASMNFDAAFIRPLADYAPGPSPRPIQMFREEVQQVLGMTEQKESGAGGFSSWSSDQ